MLISLALRSLRTLLLFEGDRSWACRTEPNRRPLLPLEVGVVLTVLLVLLVVCVGECERSEPAWDGQSSERESSQALAIAVDVLSPGNVKFVKYVAAVDDVAMVEKRVHAS